MSTCSWCNKEVSKIYNENVNGSEVSLCKHCHNCYENHECITCGEQIFDTFTINGECTACMQISSAATEKKRSEALNGLGINIISELTKSVVFTEDDYNKWLTFGQGNYTPEKYKTFRKTWIRTKIVCESGWTEEQFDENYSDIENIMINNSSTVFREPCQFILVDKNTKRKSGMMALAKSGKVYLMAVNDNQFI